MAVLATTATKKEIFASFKDPDEMECLTEFQDMERSFKEEEKTFYVYALFTGPYKKTIEEALTNSGNTFQWL